MTRLVLQIMGGMLLLAACQSNPERLERRMLDPTSGQGMIATPPIALVFVSLDSDHDRAVTQGELDAGLAALFRQADEDGNQAIDQVELQTWFMAHLGSEYPVPGRLAFDPNGDRAVTEHEFGAVFASAFTAMDRDGDGKLVRAEMIREASMPSPANTRRRMQQPMRPGGRRPGGQASMNAAMAPMA